MENQPIVEKIRGLCQFILEQEEIMALRRDIDAFMSHEESMDQYRHVVELSEALNQRQAQGEALAQEEVNGFEEKRTALLHNPVARSFIDAQQKLQEIQSATNQYLSKTFELGHVPTPEEMESCGCHSSCGCHH